MPTSVPIDVAVIHGRLVALQLEMQTLVQQVQNYQQEERILGTFLDEFATVLPSLHPSTLPIPWPIMQELTSRYRAPS